jgi:Interferon-induced transmembrane protein
MDEKRGRPASPRGEGALRRSEESRADQTQQYPPQQYPPQQYGPQQYPPQQYPPQQYGPQQYPPQQYGPQQDPPQQYSPQQFGTKQPSPHWALSVIAFLLNMAFGIPAIIFSSLVGNRWQTGNIKGAQSASTTALVLAIIGISTGGLFWFFALLGAVAEATS